MIINDIQKTACNDGQGNVSVSGSFPQTSMMSVAITKSVLLAALRCLLDDADGCPDNTRDSISALTSLIFNLERLYIQPASVGRGPRRVTLMRAGPSKRTAPFL